MIKATENQGTSGAGLPIESRILLALCCADSQVVLDTLLRSNGLASVDWFSVLQAIDRNMLVHIAVDNLGVLPVGIIPSGLIAKLRQRSWALTMRQMEIVSLQRQLARDWLIPQGVPHAFVKGALLSSHAYGGPFVRQYRDIDILMTEPAVRDLGRLLLQKGFKITNPVWPSLANSDFNALCRYSAAVEMVSPEGVGLELHNRLDNSGAVFSTGWLLDQSEIDDTLGFELRRLPTALHHVYMLFHHSRHKWASLHWVADLAATRGDRARQGSKIESAARKLGLVSTLLESDRLYSNVKEAAITGQLPTTCPRSRFLLDVLSTLDASLGARRIDKHESAPSRREPDFAYTWQKSRAYDWRFFWHRWKPSLDDFNAMPVSDRWRWVYFATRPVRSALRRLSEALHRRASG